MKCSVTTFVLLLVLLAGCRTAPAVAPDKPFEDSENVGSTSVERGRDSRWPEVREVFAREHPSCAVCGRPVENVHHGIPVHVDPSRELDPVNLYPFCREHHFVFGHLGDWHSWNPDVAKDIGIWRSKYRSRPK